MPPHLTQAAGATKHCPVGNQPPTLFQDPAILLTPCWHLLLTSLLQLPKKTCLLILLLHRWELQREQLVVLTVKHQPTRPSSQDQCNNGSVIQVMDPRPPECNALEKLCVPIPGHAIIWLGMMPLSPPPLPPSPLCPPSLLSTLPLQEFVGHIGEVHLVEQIRDDLLPLGA